LYQFDAVGLPGFPFIQDPVEYGTRTHHSNMDVYERVRTVDMMNNAVIVAAFVYNAAIREERLPREPMPVPPRTSWRSASNPGSLGHELPSRRVRSQA
jgi:hypothetical protein